MKVNMQYKLYNSSSSHEMCNRIILGLNKLEEWKHSLRICNTHWETQMQPKENTYLSTTFSLLSKQYTKLFQKAKTPGFGNYLLKKYKANTLQKKRARQQVLEMTKISQLILEECKAIYPHFFLTNFRKWEEYEKARTSRKLCSIYPLLLEKCLHFWCWLQSFCSLNCNWRRGWAHHRIW